MTDSGRYAGFGELKVRFHRHRMNVKVAEYEDPVRYTTKRRKYQPMDDEVDAEVSFRVLLVRRCV